MRVLDLKGMHRSIAAIAASGDPLDNRSCAVIVPTRAAAETLRRTLENHLLGAIRAFVLPDIVTRADLYARLHQHLPGAPPMLTEFEREVMLRRSAAAAAETGQTAPFRLRAGLIAEILGFYDELRRRNRTVEDFDRLMTGSLEPNAATDRGADRLLTLTRFLSATFRDFEQGIAAAGRLDEHRLRRLLLGHSGAAHYRRLVVTVADQTADPRGLWTADFDLFARMPGVERIEIIATESSLAAGFLERVHDLLPGLTEERGQAASTPPTLVVPETSDPNVRWFVSRDREEELAAVARAVKPYAALGDVAIGFQRPLPYLYLARHVFADAGLPYQAIDALPLAAEPFAAALDLVFTFAVGEGTRTSLIDLLASPHWRFEADADRPGPQDVAKLDGWLREQKFLGGWDRLEELAVRADAPGAIRAAVVATRQVRAALEASTASGQLRGLIAFLKSHERLPGPDDPWYGRHVRARGAILAALESLADAHARHDDDRLELTELANAVRRWIEGQTFSPRTGIGGVWLMDAPALAYADLDELRLIGLVEHDWPDRSRRNIFYPATLLTQLGWPNDRDRSSAARAAFHDLLRLPRSRVSISTFTLEDDSIVMPSSFLDEVEALGLTIERAPDGPRPRVFVHEVLFEDPVAGDAIAGLSADWLALRRTRSPAAEDRFHGAAGPRPAGVYAVSHVERYLDCPFKYFANSVLRLKEERDEQSGLTPQERGQFLHEVFESFFKEWHASGGREITTANVDEALTKFEEVAEAGLARLPEADRALERTHLLGSAAAPGLAERAFASELEQGGAVIERLLEYSLEGEFEFRGEETNRRLKIRAKADRIDLLSDGTLRVIDYKLSRAPKATRALQLPVYGICAEQHLDGRHGRSWTLARAGYIAFREKSPFVSLGSGSIQQALAEGQQRFIEAVDGIERGVFPPDPDEPFLCRWCGYAGVCRKDYVGDE
jgi:RecB family exonuclease